MSTVEQWVEKVHYDLETARAMQDTGRYQYVLFCCQQAVEKAIKAIIVKQTSEYPPRIHTLRRLAELAELELSDTQTTFMMELSNFYFHSRYPETISKIEASITKMDAKEKLEETEECVQWLLSML